MTSGPAIRAVADVGRGTCFPGGVDHHRDESVIARAVRGRREAKCAGAQARVRELVDRLLGDLAWDRAPLVVRTRILRDDPTARWQRSSGRDEQRALRARELVTESAYHSR